MRLVVDTGVFSASLGRREISGGVADLVGLDQQQVFLAAQTVAELRYGAMLARWGDARVARLEAAIASTTIVQVTRTSMTATATLRLACRSIGHPLAQRVHNADLWIAASAVHIGATLVTTDKVFEGAPSLLVA
ncbi:type II toxin-antitoxin system VapC family toxin [Aquihabitans sp. McL0605]|uniref:type II toxin-antitoxin system VapC family toxin n=1 Tax=Aquihabitans sp. McL0605 TaxID=3415671 RepID=UPI003CFBADB2